MTDAFHRPVPDVDPCPGPCNSAWRRRESRLPPTDERAWWSRSWHPVAARAGTWLDATARPGAPVWCRSCGQRVTDALRRLPELAAALWAVGHDPVRSPVQRVVDVSVRAAPTRRPARWVREHLACGHSRPSRLIEGLGPDQVPFAVRDCVQCAIDDPGGDGRLMPPEAPVRRRPGLRGSPAGSPSWLEVEEIAQAVWQAEQYLRWELGHSTDERQPGQRPSWYDGVPAVSTGAQYVLNQRADDGTPLVLAMPGAAELLERLLGLARSATRRAGMETEHRMPGVPCPSCDRAALVRPVGEEWARCRACGATASLQPRQFLDPAALS